jgi:hypothetical protein
MTVLRDRDPQWDNFHSDLDMSYIRNLIDENRQIFDQEPKKRLQIKYQNLLIIDD